MTVRLTPAPLTAEAFAPYGEVIETAGASELAVNQGTATRFDDLAAIDVAAGGGRPRLSIFRAAARELPLEIALMERHPLGSQAFVPLMGAPFLIVVGGRGDGFAADDLRAFVTAPGQGVNYARGVWHHPLIAIGAQADFLVVDRGGAGDNLEERALAPGAVTLDL